MNVTERVWMIRHGEVEEGPISEDEFQDRLRAGKIPLSSFIKSNFMDDWEPLLEVVSNDNTFRRSSTAPPPAPRRRT